MNRKLLVVKILRIIFAILILVWGMMLWKEFPEQIPLHFDASLKPDEFGEKKKFIWLFLYAFAAFLPIPPIRMENADEWKMENNKALVMSWVHTGVMCVIFIIMMMLIKYNLK